ncbi:S8 family peptidase [Yoonia vestfoldensis]|uniref:S8 family peptidase n=1 Tax=Yoonia vestfoldensis TaxID=245188 RepID=UPI0003A222B5|nr:S8 family peptidase [Yoonia vestfoldensis]
MKRSLSLVLLFSLAACNLDDAGSGTAGGVVTAPPDDGPPAIIGTTSGDNPFPWNRYFVTEFDPADVQRIRSLSGFVANSFGFNLRVTAHPVFRGGGRIVRSHPLVAARLDYALSTGLTGAGQTVSMIDDGIRLSHDQFSGKTIHTSGGAPASGDFHGTAVASVLAGNGTNGGTLGFAPGADLHQGYLNYATSVSWSTLGNHMRDAAQIGAIVSNNSWGLADKTVQNSDMGSFLWATRPYVSGLRTFAKDGVIVFALQNDYNATSASLMAALPLGAPDLEANWISVINVIPEFDDTGIRDAIRVSTACLETARFCMAANGQIKVAAQSSDSSYQIGVGASFAAPQVAGSIALLAEAFPELSAAQLRDRLLATADNGFFTHDFVHEFAPGITHGYNAEFGHGFLDLRSALLPIGQAIVPMADGGFVDLGTAAITAGAAVGDGLSQALAAVDILTTDQLYGSFSVSGAVLAGTDRREDPAAAALMAVLRTDMGGNRHAMNAAIRGGGDLAGYRNAWRDQSGAELLGGEIVPLTAPQGDLGAALVTGNATTGLSLHRRFDLAWGQAQVGLTTMRTDGTILGIGQPGNADDISSVTNALHIDVAAGLSPVTALRMTAEIGIATGDGAGLLSNLGALSYDRVGLAVAQADVRKAGDVLSIFVRQPIGITRGSARMDLPVQLTNGQVRFASHDISLAPVARQLDLGLAYQVPVSRAGNLSVGLMHSRNDGNITGQSAISGFVGMQFSF